MIPMELQIIQHKDVTPGDLKRIIAIKSAAWPFPPESQMRWMDLHVRPEDRHLILQDEGVDRAYLSLSPVMASVDGEPVAFEGVGCVCTGFPGEGWGGRLMERVGELLSQEEIPGLLFCRERLVPFYRKYGWTEVPEMHFTEPHEGIHTLWLGAGGGRRMVYGDRLF